MGDVSKKNLLKILLLNKVYFPNFANRYILNPVLTILKFYMCIKDPINKTCRKNGKDLSNGAPNIKLWNHTKKRIFRFLPKISSGHAWSWKFFFADFQILEPLGCQGWVVIPQNVKKSQNRCTLVSMVSLLFLIVALFFFATIGGLGALGIFIIWI
jgi:hypothetical protein